MSLRLQNKQRAETEESAESVESESIDASVFFYMSASFSKKTDSKDKGRRNGRFDVNLMSFSHREVIGKKRGTTRRKAALISLCGRRSEGLRGLKADSKKKRTTAFGYFSACGNTAGPAPRQDHGEGLPLWTGSVLRPRLVPWPVLEIVSRTKNLLGGGNRKAR